MGTASSQVGRRQTIATAIAAELERQAGNSAARVDVDVDALAEAVDLALSAEQPVSEGKHPQDLNATNDD